MQYLLDVIDKYVLNDENDLTTRLLYKGQFCIDLEFYSYRLKSLYYNKLVILTCSNIFNQKKFFSYAALEY